MNTTEFNVFPKYLSCKNYKCGAPSPYSLETAFATIEHLNVEKSNSTYNFTCNKCHYENKYSYVEILNFIPFSKRPKELSNNEVFVLFLIPIKTDRPMDNPAFGEFVKAKIIETNDDDVICQLLDKSFIAPTLTNRDIIYARLVSGFVVAFDKLIKQSTEESWEPIQKMAPPKEAIFGLFFVKEGSLNDELIIPANPKCSNPSCNYIFTHTASKLTDLMKTNYRTTFNYDVKYISIECPKCSTNKIITENFIKTLYPL